MFWPTVWNALQVCLIFAYPMIFWNVGKRRNITMDGEVCNVKYLLSNVVSNVWVYALLRQQVYYRKCINSWTFTRVCLRHTIQSSNGHFQNRFFDRRVWITLKSSVMCCFTSSKEFLGNMGSESFPRHISWFKQKKRGKTILYIVCEFVQNF